MAIFSGWGLKKDSSYSADYAADFQLLDLHIQHRLTGPMGRLNLAINLQVAKGTRLAILGPSGSGKTSLLRILAGLMPVEAGHIYAFGHCWLNTQQQLNLPPRKRKAGLVFQDYALFPHMSALENLLFALPKGRSKARAKYLLEAVGLEALDRQYPNQLSGGQQQRLALARALAAEPELLLLDEPLSALDMQLRRTLQDEILDLQQQAGTTLLLVTHDPGEALRLAQRAILLKDGHIVADTTPAKLFAFTQGAAAETLVLQGKVLSTPPLDNPSMGYLVEAEGQTCRAQVGTGQPLHLGEKVMLSAKQWIAQPFAEPLTSEPLVDPSKSADSDGLPSDKSAFPA